MRRETSGSGSGSDSARAQLWSPPPHLPTSPGKLLPRKRGLLKPHRRPGGVCAAGVMRGRVPTCGSGHRLSAEQSLSSVQSCWATLLVPGAGCGCSSGRVQARATVPGDHLQGWAAPGGQGGMGPETGLELLAEQGPLVASRGWCCLTFHPAEALCPSLGALEAGLEVLSLSGDQEPLDHTPRPERWQLPPAGAQGCPRVMLPAAPRNAGPD